MLTVILTWGKKTTIKSKYKKRDVVLFAVLHWLLILYLFAFHYYT
nr:MAG TPA: Triple QxxK/R motif-containing protein family [Caudoviricetes sp.]